MDITKKEDLRIRRTRKLLMQALFSLLERKSFQSISVKEICDAAMIHRTTFYTHFDDKYDLMSYGLKDIIDEFQFIKGNLQENQIRLLRVSKKYKSLFSQLLMEEQNPLLYAIIKEMNIGFEAALKFENKEDKLSSEIAIAAMSSASMGVIQWWLAQSEDISDKKINDEMKKIFNWDYIEKFYPDHFEK